MSNGSVMTLRIPEALSDELALVLAVDGGTRSAIIRDALAAHVAARKSDPEFRERARLLVARLTSQVSQ